jgi:transcriptional regulator with XRE-family HTH domain
MDKLHDPKYPQGMLASISDPIQQPVGELLRTWRQRRRLSQLDLACDAEISTRHLSFLETGRALPSRGMVLKLSEYLDIPLRERNSLLIAAGYAPVYPQRPLAHPEMQSASQAIDLVLSAHEPYPALAIDRHWNLIASNSAVPPLLVGVAARLLEPPVNVLRLSLHPEGIASRITNLQEWRSHILKRLRRQIDSSGDQVLANLMQELTDLHVSKEANHKSEGEDSADVVVPFSLAHGDNVLRFLTTTMVFGTAVDVTLSELAIEVFFPADTVTAEIFRASQRPLPHT